MSGTYLSKVSADIWLACPLDYHSSRLSPLLSLPCLSILVPNSISNCMCLRAKRTWAVSPGPSTTQRYILRDSGWRSRDFAFTYSNRRRSPRSPSTSKLCRLGNAMYEYLVGLGKKNGKNGTRHPTAWSRTWVTATSCCTMSLGCDPVLQDVLAQAKAVFQALDRDSSGARILAAAAACLRLVLRGGRFGRDRSSARTLGQSRQCDGSTRREQGRERDPRGKAALGCWVF